MNEIIGYAIIIFSILLPFGVIGLCIKTVVDTNKEIESRHSVREILEMKMERLDQIIEQPNAYEEWDSDFRKIKEVQK